MAGDKRGFGETRSLSWKQHYQAPTSR